VAFALQDTKQNHSAFHLKATPHHHMVSSKKKREEQVAARLFSQKRVHVWSRTPELLQQLARLLYDRCLRVWLRAKSRECLPDEIIKMTDEISRISNEITKMTDEILRMPDEIKNGVVTVTQHDEVAESL
jgi:hypothetical protein